MILPSDAADDQSNCPPDYYRRSNGMLHQIPTETAPQSPEIDAKALEGMTRDQLLALVKKMPGWPVALMTKAEQAEAIITRFAIEALDPNSKQWQPAGQQVLDRTQGKAIQRVDQRVLHAHKGIAVDMPTDELMALVKGMRQLPDGIMLLADGTLDIVDHEDPPTIDQ